jgi:hypothetical protein
VRPALLRSRPQKALFLLCRAAKKFFRPIFDFYRLISPSGNPLEAAHKTNISSLFFNPELHQNRETKGTG